MSTRVEIEAIFGSVVRGDNDCLSDRDILIVDDDLGALRDRQASLEDEGWSVASYSYSKLFKLADRGALFIQHLKLESAVVEDRNGRLRTLLEDFRTKQSYQAEISDNAELANLVAVRPRSERGALWAGDVLCVALRNFGVLTLAERGRFTFSYNGIINDLLNAGIVSDGEVWPLLRLRALKRAYRRGESADEGETSHVVQHALRLLPHASFPQESSPVCPITALRACRESAASNVPYHRLRNLERGYVALLASGSDFANHEIFQRISNWIENPRCYAGLAGDLSDQLIDEMAVRLDASSFSAPVVAPNRSESTA